MTPLLSLGGGQIIRRGRTKTFKPCSTLQQRWILHGDWDTLCRLATDRLWWALSGPATNSPRFQLTHRKSVSGPRGFAQVTSSPHLQGVFIHAPNGNERRFANGGKGFVGMRLDELEY